MAIDFPVFPADVPTHPLIVVDYDKIKLEDEKEIDKLWNAATQIGFWYLKNHGADDDVEAMFEMGRQTMDLPLEEKMKFSSADFEEGTTSLGYKAQGEFAIDEHGTPDTIEYITVARDDALAYPRVVHRTYPSTVYVNMNNGIRPFVQRSDEVNGVLMSALARRLGLPKGTFAERHTLDEPSGSEARTLKTPARPKGVNEVALYGHTDFGSLTFLHNRLGGLQVLVPETEDWQYIKPLPGHAICNIGDALTLLSGGILRSNMHRVVPPPSTQRTLDRWSVGYFSRPGHCVKLDALEDMSPIISRAVAESKDPGLYRSGKTSKEWLMRRFRNQRTKYRTGPETWNASRGTEHNMQKV